MKRLNANDAAFQRTLDALLRDRQALTSDPEVDTRVRQILGEVRDAGDAALLRWTLELDGLAVADASELAVSEAECAAALNQIGDSLRADLELAAARIQRFHEEQRVHSFEMTTEYGVKLSQRCDPLARVGVYVPGGTAAYPSSVLMNVIPARVAGVKEIVMVTPAPGGVVSPAVLAAASIAGATQVFRVGGAQAIGALAYGSTVVPRVDKIVGPGNQWVAAAKRLVFGVVDIDMVAGPSELCVIATLDGGASSAQLAADLLSQAEHDPSAMVSFISPDAPLIDSLLKDLERQLVTLPRFEIARASIANWGCVIQTSTISQAIDLANEIAPEHLELVVPDAERWSAQVTAAGAIFCGPYTPEAVGDYLAGPNHVLPTCGTARFSSPLGVYDFVKRTNMIRFTSEALDALGPATIRLAESEGLHAHAESVRLRLESE
jgi:histidinol dehydrogenase